MEELKPKANAAGPVEPVPAGERVRRRADQPRIRAAVRDHGPHRRSAPEVVQLLGARHRQHGGARPLRHARSRRSSGSSRCSTARSAPRFAMTEPAVASSDATNIESRIERDGDDYVINGRKWWTSGAGDPRCKIASSWARPTRRRRPHQQQSMILVPMDTPGVTVERMLPVFGYDDAPHGHAEIDVRERARAGGEHAARRGPRLRDRAGPARARAASTTACARSAWPSARWRRCASARSRASRSASRSPSRA